VSDCFVEENVRLVIVCSRPPYIYTMKDWMMTRFHVACVIKTKLQSRRKILDSDVICVDAHCRMWLSNNNLTKIPEVLWLFENLNM